MSSGDTPITWRYTNEEGEVNPRLQKAMEGDTLIDLRHNKLFHFLGEIETLTAIMFKGHYFDEADVILERSPRHLRQLTELERQNMRCTTLGCTTTVQCRTPSPYRGEECGGCVRMSVIPSPSTGQGKQTAVTPRRVSPCEQGDIIGEHFFTRSMTSLQEFALQINNTLADLKTVGRCLGLRVLDPIVPVGNTRTKIVSPTCTRTLGPLPFVPYHGE